MCDHRTQPPPSQERESPRVSKKPDRLPMEHRLVPRFLLALNRLVSRGYHHVDVQTPSVFPKSGPAILISNHISGLDPLLIQSAIPRMAVWMMASEYYKIPGLKKGFEAIEAIPVDRKGRDSTATRAALRALAEGSILGVFPEGRIEKTRDLLPFQTGVAMMALRTKTPVYPVYIDGTTRGLPMVEAVLTPNDCRLRFGPPIDLSQTAADDKPDLDICTGRLRDAVAKLKSEMTYNK